ncbi:hypothetical protein [Nocardioides sp. R-C-SC26]|uniref:hypothetical protein n=1 Tax=Nocardioides sp. R-C-SC26 TaxID=2870414 RepID=UPI001E4F1974|nr:hypothetical protein [Nocardioides sp. R-C-SC26]
MKTLRISRGVIAVCSLALVVTACGADGEPDDETSPSASSAAPPRPPVADAERH